MTSDKTSGSRPIGTLSSECQEFSLMLYKLQLFARMTQLASLISVNEVCGGAGKFNWANVSADGSLKNFRDLIVKVK